MPIVTLPSFPIAVSLFGDAAADKLAIVLPGRLETKDYVHIQSHLAQLSGMGHHAVSFDPPGSWESPGDITDYTGSNYLLAVHELIAYYGNKPTILIGHSLGGSVAELAAAANPHVVGHMSLMTLVRPRPAGTLPQTDSEWLANGSLAFYRDLPPGDRPTPHDQQRRFDLPYSFVLDRHHHDVLAARQSLKPKLYVFGNADEQQGTPAEIRQAFATIAKPKQLIELNSYHSYRYSQSHIDYINQQLDRFVKSL